MSNPDAELRALHKAAKLLAMRTAANPDASPSDLGCAASRLLIARAVEDEDAVPAGQLVMAIDANAALTKSSPQGGGANEQLIQFLEAGGAGPGPGAGPHGGASHGGGAGAGDGRGQADGPASPAGPGRAGKGAAGGGRRGAGSGNRSG
jgi:hypothetical protein